MPHAYSYYANGHNGQGAYPNNSQKLAEDAINAADAAGVDFQQFDTGPNSPRRLCLFILHAGRGGEYSGSSSDMWSHSWTTHAPSSRTA